MDNNEQKWQNFLTFKLAAFSDDAVIRQDMSSGKDQP